MPKIKFLQPRKLGKKRYPKGICEVPAADCKGWFYDELLKCGDIVEVSDVVAPTAEGVEDKGKATAGGPPKPDGKPAKDDDSKPSGKGK